MPYIDKPSRSLFDRHIDALVLQTSTPGDLNYIITRLLKQHFCLPDGVRYTHLNEAIGILECAKLEFYRIFAAPYEDEKIKENGPVL